MVESCIRTQDSNISVGRKALKNSLYKGHRYEWTFDDAIEMIKKLTVEDMKRLHKKYIRSDQMILAVAGSAGKQSFKEIIQRVCADLNSEGTVGSFEQLADEEQLDQRQFVPGERVNINMMRDQAVLLLGQPSPLNLFHEDYIPVKILNLICFHSLGSRIYELREKTGLFYNASGAFAAGSDNEKGYDFAFAIVNPENLDKAEEKIKGVMETLQKEGITQKELNEARQIYLKGLIDATTHVSDIAAMLSNKKALGLPFDYYDKVLERLQNISVEELNAIAKKYADPSKMMTVRVGRV
ncbi:insulinase family protein [Candidatus Babeliales bacterium]|nr:insulinase family protein [Candidatus Babeliales bacterium]